MEDEDNTWSTDLSHLHSIVVQYFMNLFSRKRQVCFEDILPSVPCKVGEIDNCLLIAPVHDVEIEQAFYQMHPTKSLGLDGFTTRFFQHHWETVDGVVKGMVQKNSNRNECLRN